LGKKYGDYHIKSSNDMALYLLEEMKVGVVPGSAFGVDNSVRISFSPPLLTVKNGLQAIIDGFNQLN
jgi:aspartate aminotransferase